MLGHLGVLGQGGGQIGMAIVEDLQGERPFGAADANRSVRSPLFVQLLNLDFFSGVVANKFDNALVAVEGHPGQVDDHAGILCLCPFVVAQGETADLNVAKVSRGQLVSCLSWNEQAAQRLYPGVVEVDRSPWPARIGINRSEK